MGVSRNPPISKNLIPLSIIMMCECPALLLAGSLILKETKAHYLISLLIIHGGPSPHFSFINKGYVHSWHVTQSLPMRLCNITHHSDWFL
jgi:hypothetical protein